MLINLKHHGLPKRDGVLAYDIPFTVESMNVTLRTVRERTPEERYMRNRISDMIVIATSGSIYLYLQGEDGLLLQKDDIIEIPKMTKYYWIPDPSAELLLISSPPWNKEQNELVDG